MRTIFLLPLLLVLPVAGCRMLAPPEYDFPKFSELSPAPEPYLDIINKRYPANFKMYHRVVLTVGGRQMDFTGCLEVRDREIFRGVAFGELGGKFLEFKTVDGYPEIIWSPSGINRNALTNGMLIDLKNIYCGQTNSAKLFRRRNVLYYGMEGCITEFIDGKMLPAKMLFMRGGRIIRQVQCKEYAAFPGWKLLLPKLIVVENYLWDYRVEIELLKFEKLENSLRKK